MPLHISNLYENIYVWLPKIDMLNNYFFTVELIGG